ncbi:MAG TPA: HEPN domain-containing protein [bacterium]|nr:HEPN domain-containing protein [bacterium]
MPRKEIAKGSPQEWLAFAKSDLKLAKAGKVSGVLLSSLCFHAQQAAEKAIKAVLVLKRKEFPPTHNIKVLIDLLPGSAGFPEKSQQASLLTMYAVNTRYPGDLYHISQKDYAEALSLAGAVVRWATAQVRKAGTKNGLFS